MQNGLASAQSNLAHMVEPARDRLNRHDVTNRRGIAFREFNGSGETALVERVLLHRFGQAVMKVRSDFFQPHDLDVFSIPGWIVTPTIRKPEKREAQNGRIF